MIALSRDALPPNHRNAGPTTHFFQVVMGLDVAESELVGCSVDGNEECRKKFLDLIHDIKLSAQTAVNVLDGKSLFLFRCYV